MNKLISALTKHLRTQRGSKTQDIRKRTNQARRWITAHSKKWDSVKLIRAIRDAR